MWWLFCLAIAHAHDLQPGVIAAREVAPQEWALRLQAPQDGGGLPVRFQPQWPSHCQSTGLTLQCDGDLHGVVRVPGLDRRRVRLLIDIQPLSGDHEQHLLAEGEHEAHIGRPTGFGIFWMGWEHVLAGLDHILFVCGLALVCTGRRRIAAVTAFTVSHSLTLGLTAMGLLVTPTEAVELLIAASLLLLAREALSEQPTWTRTYPALVAGMLGLAHGIGFAGGLSESGLTGPGLLMGLLSFNLGVEAAQLAVLAVAACSLLLMQRSKYSEQLLQVSAYIIGLPAGYWTLQRLWYWLTAVLG